MPNRIKLQSDCAQLLACSQFGVQAGCHHVCRRMDGCIYGITSSCFTPCMWQVLAHAPCHSPPPPENGGVELYCLSCHPPRRGVELHCRLVTSPAEAWGRGYSLVTCLSHLTIDHVSLTRRSTAVPTSKRDTSNIWAIITFFPDIS